MINTDAKTVSATCITRVAASRERTEGTRFALPAPQLPAAQCTLGVATFP